MKTLRTNVRLARSVHASERSDHLKKARHWHQFRYPHSFAPHSFASVLRTASPPLMPSHSDAAHLHNRISAADHWQRNGAKGMKVSGITIALGTSGRRSSVLKLALLRAHASLQAALFQIDFVEPQVVAQFVEIRGHHFLAV